MSDQILALWLPPDGTPLVTVSRRLSLQELGQHFEALPVAARRQAEGAQGLELPLPEALAAGWRAVLVAIPDEPPAPTGPSQALARILGQSAAILEAKEFAARIAGLRAPVLIEGETGTGKELFARAIHECSPAAGGPFVAINCGAIPDTLAESELFGYESGAFTGARPQGHAGVFEQADGGTLFLDEVAELNPTLQAKLLRVLEDGEVRRLGGRRTRAVSVRLVAAANRSLRQRVQEGRFREDLFYRLNVLSLRLPPLRARREDIPLLFSHFLAVAAEGTGKAAPHLDDACMRLLTDYDWPGNVRELKNVALKSVVLAGSRLKPTLLRTFLSELNGERAGGSTLEPQPESGTLKAIQEETEWRMIQDALIRTGGNKAEAARLLGIHRATLYEKLRRYRIES